MMDDTTWMNAKKAIELGFADAMLEDSKRSKDDLEAYAFSSAAVEKAIMNKIAAKCKAAEVPGRLIPVPRTITAGCGMCWSAPWKSREAVEDLVMEAHLDVDGIYRVVL